MNDLTESAWDGDIWLTEDEMAALIQEAHADSPLSVTWGLQRVRLLPVEGNLWALRRLGEMRGLTHE